MESYRMTGLPKPFQRPLSRLYNDTKKSSDFVKEPVQNAEDPEIKALHRKLRIQKDRLVSWGLEWSDPSQSSEVLIDSSISQAGLSEVVSSVMSTIKEILAEVEPLWLSSKRLVGEESSPADRGLDRKLPVVTWDKDRFSDLVRDLTASIDTLYDSSRARSSHTFSSKMTAPYTREKFSPAEDFRPFEPARMQVPHLVRRTAFTGIQSPHLPDSLPGTETREIVSMGKQAYLQLSSHSRTLQANSPLLVEYAYFDPVYSSTGIMPSMARFEKLSSGLQAEMQRHAEAYIGLPRLIGYFEEMDRSRLGLVFQFPPGYNVVVPSDVATHNPRSCVLSLGDMLSSPSIEPRLEVKFRLASSLANTIFEMHARGIAHGSLGDSSILFGRDSDPAASATDISRADLRKPLICGFDIFPGTQQPESNQQSPLFRHPLNPQSFSPEATPLVDADPRAFDLYSVAMLLLSIGMWTKVESLVPYHELASVPETVLDQLAVQCGTLYMKAVQTCWNAMETVISARTPNESPLSKVELKVSNYLRVCCALDSLSSFEDRPPEKPHNQSSFESFPSTVPPALTPSPSYYSNHHMQSMDSKPLNVDSAYEKGRLTSDYFSLGMARPAATDFKPPSHLTTRSSSKSAQPSRPDTAFSTQTRALATERSLPPTEKVAPVCMKLFPHISLPPEIVEQWHSFLMPQINLALKSFYRSHPESVEISLESVGESPRSTRPTVVVVCTSVSKVRSILKRKLGGLLDGSSGFCLKVCHGRVVRSRKDGDGQHDAARERQDRDDGTKKHFYAANNRFQERPQNGASIGAWNGDLHLPPVSFGGLVLVDEKPFGMTVHHMLDDPDAVEAAAPREGQKALRSSSAAATKEVEALGQSLLDWYADLQSHSASGSPNDDDFACEFSDTNSAVSDSDLTSNWSDSGDEDDDKFEGGEPGDVPGIEPGFGDRFVVTQPALDDVEKDFYPDEDNQDDEHLYSCSLGDIFASSGVRRRMDERGLVHEIDWALFEFKENRQPHDNFIPHLPLASQEVSLAKAHQAESQPASPPKILHPTTVAPSSALPGLEVQCMARTSGLQTGRILPTITSVKIYGRTTPSHAYQISGSSSAAAVPASPLAQEESGPVVTAGSASNKRQALPIGIPGDSGAWIVEREHGRLCGHVLAWSGRKKVAYLCPMDVMLLDIAETLAAGEVRLPGGEAVVKLMDVEQRRKNKWKGRRADGKDRLEGGDSEADEGKDADDEDEGYHEEHKKTRETMAYSSSKEISSMKIQQEVGLEPTKMMELAGRLDKVHLRQSNVETAC